MRTRVGAIQTVGQETAVVDDPAAACNQHEAARQMPAASCCRAAAAGCSAHRRAPIEDLAAALHRALRAVRTAARISV